VRRLLKVRIRRLNLQRWGSECTGSCAPNVQNPAWRRGSGCCTRNWLGGGGFGDDDVDETALLALVLELHDAGNLGVEGIVGAAADVEAGLMGCAALADEDGAAGDGFAVAALDAEPLGVRIATVFGGA
jgi:hypothetical protein